MNFDFEILTLLTTISEQLKGINDRLFAILSECAEVSCNVKDICGTGMYGMDDIIDKLNDVELSVDSIAGGI